MPNGKMDVAAGAPNPQSFTNNGDGTLTDKITGLMWQKGLAPTYLSYSGALAYCPTLTLGGHSDWRLPSIIELVSITDPGLYKPAIDTTLFTPPPSGGLWSSLRSASQQTRALLLNSDLGVPSAMDFTGVFDVRCVR